MMLTRRNSPASARPVTTLVGVLLVTILMAGHASDTCATTDENTQVPPSGTIRLRAAATYDAASAVITLDDVANLTGDYAGRLAGLIIRSDVSQPSLTITLSDVRAALESPAYTAAASGPTSINQALLAISGGRCYVTARQPVPDPSDTGQPDPADSRDQARADGQATPERPSFWVSRFNDQPDAIGAIVSQVLAARLTSDMQPRDIQLTCSAEDFIFLCQPAAGREVEVIPHATAMSPRVPVEINLHVGPTITESRRMTIDVAALLDVIVLQDYIASGREIRPENVAIETRLVTPSTIPVYPIDLPHIGKMARARLSKGQILHVNDLVDPVLIKARAQVIVRARAGNWIVRMPAIALEDGRPGQIIRVRQLTDRTELMARIEPDGELVIPTSTTTSEQ